ncbi:unnamed protein product [Effrenium voratum]|nr:unnamed protein product [Effrenium voratum]
MMELEFGNLSNKEWTKTVLHLLFCLVLGWTNSIMMFRFRIFATMMVGNTILMGVSLACKEGLVVMPDSIQLCPAELSPGYYGQLIFLFVLGAFFHGLMQQRRGWTPKEFAPLIVLVVLIEEARSHLGGSHVHEGYAYMLAPVFGITGSISMKCGLQGPDRSERARLFMG